MFSGHYLLSALTSVAVAFEDDDLSVVDKALETEIERSTRLSITGALVKTGVVGKSA